MPVLEDLTEDECYLLAILDDQSGLDQAEMMWVDERQHDGIFRAWPFQVPWWRCSDERQIDQCVAAGQLVSTSRGPLPIEDVQIGDNVLTHKRRWRRVIDVVHRGRRPVIEVRGAAGATIVCTPGHPVWARLPDGSERWLEAQALVEAGAEWLRAGQWEPVASSVDAGVADVHDIDVAEDRSFTVGAVAVHNCGRSVGKTLGVTMRLWSFPLRRPGEEALITAPELVHLRPVTDLIETQLLDTRLTREMLRVNKGGGSFTHQPFAVRFKNGARIMGRLPQKTGRGVKGQHPSELEMDEAQDYPKPGWTELFATLKKGEGSSWRSHGVTRGVQDEFYRFSQPESGWTVHQLCLPTGTMVYSTNGPVAIEQIRVGTSVYTIAADGQLSCDAVTAQVDNGVRATWRVRAKGGYGLISTFNHPYLVLHRGGTRRTRRELQFEWVEAQHLREGDYIIGVSELPPTGTRVPTPEEVTSTLQDHSPKRFVPPWVWEATPAMQLAFLHGYLMGDGCLSHQTRGQDPWQVGTASERMAKELRALCHYLGLRTTVIGEHHASRLSDGPMFSFYVYPDAGWFRQIPLAYSKVRDGQMLEGLGKNFVARRVSLSEPTGDSAQTWDISVGTDHNFIAEGVVVHNTAMHRPTWTDAERQMEVSNYGGGKDDPDYRRNVMGFHGDATNMLFVTSRLMKCVDDDRSSEFNTDEFTHFELTAEQVDALGDGGDPRGLLPFSERHRSDYSIFWAGMDVGYTADPSEILVFAEYHLSEQERAAMRERRKARPIEGVSRLKLVARITLKRFSAPDQMMVLIGLDQFYNLQGLGFDKTGNGLPLYQFIQKVVRGQTPWINPDLVEAAQQLAGKIKGYNFSAKEIVDLDDQVEVDELDGDPVKETAMRKLALEQATDVLREYVDHERLWLPWEQDTQQSVIKEFGGQTFSYSRSAIDQHGRPRRVFSTGKFHALDGARMFAMAHSQAGIEAIVNAKPVQESVVVIAGGGY